MKKYKYHALTKYSSFLPDIIRIDEEYNITQYDVRTKKWIAAPDDILGIYTGDIESESITEEQANEIIKQTIAIREENLKKSNPEKKHPVVQISPDKVRATKVRPERVKQYLEISADTKTFAQQGDSYLLTNEQEWDYETADHTKIIACKIDTRLETITDCLSLSRFTNHNPYWMIPSRQLTPEELEKVKHYKRV